MINGFFDGILRLRKNYLIFQAWKIFSSVDDASYPRLLSSRSNGGDTFGHLRKYVVQSLLVNAICLINLFHTALDFLDYKMQSDCLWQNKNV